VKAALGADYKRYVYDATSSAGAEGQNVNPANSSAVRNVKAGFAELFVPLVGPGNAIPLVQALNISLAGRYDSYSDFGSTFNPKVGATWSPIADLTLRASWGRSFHAPDMGDSYAVDTRAIFFANFAIHPPGSPPVDSIVLAGGNPGLKPEKGKTYSFGADYAPSWLPGLRGSITYYAVDFTDQIQTAPLSAAIFTNPAYSGFYVLNPTRAQLDEIGRSFRLISMTLPIPQVGEIVDLRRNNLASTRTRGIDFDVAYHLATDFGSWAAEFSGNDVLSREVESAPLSPFVDQPDIQKWNSRASLAWLNGPWSANASLNYSGGFKLTYAKTAGGTATENVKPFITVDLRAAYDIPQHGWLQGTTLSVNVNNAFDERPPFQMIGGAGAGAGNPLGRMIWLGLLKRW
jgi:iron complex outermembrane receptor protein